MNRRNALLGLGAVVTGGGALLGSGAFTSVTADREVSISVNDDASSYVELVANNTQIANNSGGSANNQLALNADKLNPDATTVFEDAFDVTNTNSNARYLQIPSISTSNTNTLEFVAFANINDVSSDVNLSTDYVELAGGATITVGLDITTADTAAGTDNTTATIKVVSDASTLNGSNGGTEST